MKQWHLGKYSNEKFHTSTLVKGRTLGTSAGFASALNNINNVTIPDLLAFLVMMLLSSLCCFPLSEAYTSRKLQDHENIHGGGFF